MANFVSTDFPEGCDSGGAECLSCVRRTAMELHSLTVSPTLHWSSSIFRIMYTHAACRQMESHFILALNPSLATCPVAPAA